MYNGKYFLCKNVRLNNEITCNMQDYPTAKDAEVAFHTEVAYGLSLDNLVLAHYIVVNEYGVKYDGLEKTIDGSAV